MRFLAPNSFNQHAGRWLAITALLVMVSGKLVHLGQECDGCCAGQACAATSHKSERNAPCPFGCTHHDDCRDAKSGSDGQDSPQKEHDEHQCSVCSILAYVTSGPAVLGLPDEGPLVVGLVDFTSETAIPGATFKARPRGPPAGV